MPRSANRLFLAFSLTFVAINLRPALTCIGPLLQEAIKTTGLGLTGTSILTSAPVVVLGVIAPFGAILSRRIGAERGVVAVLGLIACGLLLRLIGSGSTLILGGLVSAVGIGIGNVLLPGLIKRDFADKSALMVGVYTMALCFGGGAAAGTVVPLALWTGGTLEHGWPMAMSLWALPAALAILLWLPHVPKRGNLGTAPGARTTVKGVWRSPLAWQVTALMGLQSSLAYAVFSWLAPILRDRGMPAETAGLVVFVSFLLQVPAALIAPTLAGRWRGQRVAVTLCLALILAGFIGCLFLPLSLAWASGVVLGLGQGAIFGVAVLLIVLRSANGAVAAELSAMAQGVGYTCAAAGPLLYSLLHSLTTGWLAIGGLTAGILGLALIAGLLAGRPKTIHGV